MFLATVIFSTNGIHAIALLIGFELNVSIKEAGEEDKKKNQTFSCNEETV